MVGQWSRFIYTYGIGGSPKPNYYYLFLNKDGTFHWSKMSTAEYSYKGKYSVSNGKIYFKNVVFTNDDYKENEPDSFVDFVIVSDSHGDQLRFDNAGNSFTGSSWWRRY